MTTNFTVNGKAASSDAPPATPLLWVIREGLKLTGTKFGCGAGLHGPYRRQARFSCQTQIQDVAGKSITTIEGLSPDSSHPLQEAWLAERVPQCGYCQSGQIMSAAALLKQKPKPTRAEIIGHMNTNICRCGTYPRIVRAIERVASGRYLRISCARASMLQAARRCYAGAGSCFSPSPAPIQPNPMISRSAPRKMPRV